MKLLVACIGRASRGPERDLYDHYANRIRWPLALRELEEKKKLPANQLMLREGELVGVVRTRWRGFSGGDEAWSAIDRMLASLAEKDRFNVVAADVGGGGGSRSSTWLGETPVLCLKIAEK